MKVAILLFLTLSSLLALVRCYGGAKFEPLREFIKAQSLKKSSNVVAADVSTEYTTSYVGVQDGLKELDKITKLPGQPSVKFDQYSGYVTVDPKAGRALFYYFTEAEDSSKKPLVLWLNGGPGCSSIGNGAFAELGPFRVYPDGKTLWYNKYSWNNVANVLFLESPAGVGFSYSNMSSDYTTGDKKTAADSYTFLVNWFERFPEYKNRDFYITGESYAGHYVPQLADLILQNNKMAERTFINLKGIAIGNAYIDYADNFRGMRDHFWMSALLSDQTHQQIVQNCNFSSPSSVSEICKAYLEQASKEIGNIYFYNIYEPFCSSSPSFDTFSLTGFDPCSFDYVIKYLNTPEVQKALHANNGTWDSCSIEIGGKWQDSPNTVLPLIKKLMATGIRIWVYSGDTDGLAPVTATKYSMPKLGSPVKTSWYPWYSRGQVGGYVVGYANVTFVSVRGAGHFVPSYQPARALDLISSFLKGKLPPGLE